jgi:hypothetical protein
MRSDALHLNRSPATLVLSEVADTVLQRPREHFGNPPNDQLFGTRRRITAYACTSEVIS